MSQDRAPRYREIEAAGTPRELGRQIGEQVGEEIRSFCAVALERVNKSLNVSRQRADEVVQSSLQFAEEYRADLVEELRGTAEAAGVSLHDLMLLQVRNQFTAEDSGACTALSVARSTTDCVVAQTWDNDPLLDEFTVVLTRRPEGRPAFVSCTQAGLIAYMGFNESGIGACVNTLPAPSRPAGVPHYFTLRELFEADSLTTAVAAIDRARRAIPANIMLATPEGPADLEVMLDCVHVLRPDDGVSLVHTNHCLHPDSSEINTRFPELIQSHARIKRIDSLVRANAADLEQLKAILRDHDGYPRSICRHANDDPINGFWETVFALIIEPAARRMHISRGTPCSHEFEVYELR